jgi:hypothetical protein
MNRKNSRGCYRDVDEDVGNTNQKNLTKVLLILD